MLQGEGNQSLEDYLSTFNAKMEFEIVIRAESNNYKAMLSHILRPPYLDSFADMTHITETERYILHCPSSPCFGNSTSPGSLHIAKEDFVCLDHSSLDSPPSSPLLFSLPSSPSSSSPSTSLHGSVIDGLVEKASSLKMEKTVLVFTSAWPPLFMSIYT